MGETNNMPRYEARWQSDKHEETRHREENKKAVRRCSLCVRCSFEIGHGSGWKRARVASSLNKSSNITHGCVEHRNTQGLSSSWKCGHGDIEMAPGGAAAILLFIMKKIQCLRNKKNIHHTRPSRGETSQTSQMRVKSNSDSDNVCKMTASSTNTNFFRPLLIPEARDTDVTAENTLETPSGCRSWPTVSSTDGSQSKTYS